jgi:hypothetical protein
MPRKTNTTSQPCLFCNSLSHTTGWCNSNMKGRRKTLMEMKDCMMSDEMPDFNSFSVNELRLVVSRVVLKYKKSVFSRKQFTTDEIKLLRNQIPLTLTKTRMTDEIKLLRNQIPLTLTKTRMVRELVKQWNLYGRIRSVKSTTPEDGDDCPICLDCMKTPIWNSRQLRWDMSLTKQPSHDAMFPNNIITQCGHTFCGPCWEIHYRTNRRRRSLTTMLLGGHEQCMYLACPMCRHELAIP